MRDFEMMRRSVARKTGYYTHRSSRPLISGDTYRALCNFQIDSAKDIFKLDFSMEYSGFIYLRAEIASIAIDSVLSNSQGDFSESTFIIHNGDKIPEVDSLIELSRRTKHVYSVNLLSNIPGLSPLPIGLENWSYLRNGVPNDYKNYEPVPRDISLLISFNDSTNPNERKLARHFAKSVGGAVFLGPENTPRKYRDLVKRSKFVLSPPGNGLDCHRTWEAFYLGATPIVKAQFWPFSKSSLPALVVDDWAELSNELLENTPRLTISSEELFHKYVEPFCGD